MEICDGTTRPSPRRFPGLPTVWDCDAVGIPVMWHVRGRGIDPERDPQTEASLPALQRQWTAAFVPMPQPPDVLEVQWIRNRAGIRDGRALLLLPNQRSAGLGHEAHRATRIPVRLTAVWLAACRRRSYRAVSTLAEPVRSSAGHTGHIDNRCRWLRIWTFGQCSWCRFRRTFRREEGVRT